MGCIDTALPRPAPAWATAHKLGSWSTLHSWQAAQQVGGRPFQVTALNLLQAACLSFVSFRWSECLLCSLTVTGRDSGRDSQLLLLTCGRKGHNGSGTFQGLPKAILSYLPSCFKSLPEEWSVSPCEETYTKPVKSGPEVYTRDAEQDSLGRSSLSEGKAIGCYVT